MKKIFCLLAALLLFPTVKAEIKLEDMNWTQRGSDPTHSASAEWKLGPNFNIDTSPLMVPDIIEGVCTWGDQIIVNTQSKSILAFSKGKEVLWRTDLRSKALGIPAVWQKAVYVLTTDGYFTKIDAYTGNKLQEIKFAEEGSADVTISGKFTLISCKDKVVCYDLVANLRKWHLATDDAPQTVAVCGSYVVINHQSKLTCLNLFNGKQLWQIGTTPRAIFSGTPVIGSSTVFISTLDSKLHAYSLISGNELWNSHQVAVTPVTYDSNRIYFPSTDSVICLKADNGAQVWTSKPFTKPVWSQLIKTKSCLIGSSRDTKVVVLNPDNGKIIGNLPIAKQVVVDMAVGNDYIVIPDQTYSVEKSNRLYIMIAKN